MGEKLSEMAAVFYGVVSGSNLIEEVKIRNDEFYDYLGNIGFVAITEMMSYETSFLVQLFRSEAALYGDWNPTPAERLRANREEGRARARVSFAGRTFEEWIGSLRLDGLDRLVAGIRLGLGAGTSPEEVARSLFGTKSLNYRDGSTGVSRRYVRQFLVTCIEFAVNEARDLFFRGNDPITRVQWQSPFDSGNEICKSRDGRVFAMGSLYPVPPPHIGCRSFLTPIFANEKIPAKIQLRGWVLAESGRAVKILGSSLAARVRKSAKEPYVRKMFSRPLDAEGLTRWDNDGG